MLPRWGKLSEGSTGPVVELVLDPLDFFWGEIAHGGALGRIVANDTIGLFNTALFPRRMLVAEKDVFGREHVLQACELGALD